MKETNGDNDISIKGVKSAAQFSIKTFGGIEKSHLHVHGYLLDNYDYKQFTTGGKLVNCMPAPLAEKQLVLENNLINFIVKRCNLLCLLSSPPFSKHSI